MSPNQAPAANGARAHVLVADDDPALRDLLADVLASEGLRVTTARTGQEVLRQMAADALDLVLLDVRMPRLEPAAFARAWRAAAPGQDVRVVVLSGLAQVPEPLRALSAVAPVRKPFDLDELLDLVTDNCKAAQGACAVSS